MTAAIAPEPLDAVEAEVVVDEPGVYDIPEDQYHGDPVPGGSLSHSGAKTLVSKTPALFDYERKHGRPSKAAFDFGHVAHRILLGVGPAIEIFEAENWTKKADQTRRKEVYAKGGVPILRREHAEVIEMADAIRRHPLASKLLAPGAGRPEVSAFARDPDTGVMMRCRYDFLRRPGPSGQLLLVDYKTADCAADDAFAKSAANYGYYIQDVWYSRIAERLGMADEVAFLFVVQEKTPPYLVNVIQLDAEAVRLGERQMRRAIDIYQACTATGLWPGYGDDVVLVGLPSWFAKTLDEEDL